MDELALDYTLFGCTLSRTGQTGAGSRALPTRPGVRVDRPGQGVSGTDPAGGPPSNSHVGLC